MTTAIHQHTTTAQAVLATIAINAATIELQPGERYAGLLLGPDGQPAHHLVLLPGDSDDIDWAAAKEWAAAAGGELPTRQEQALLYANLKAEFKLDWYWSSEEYRPGGSLAWIQYFYYGFQGNNDKSYEARARAVRRFTA